MQEQSIQILRIDEVCRRTRLSRSHIRRLVAGADFPAPVRLGVRATGWVESEVDQWLWARIAASRATGPA